MPFLFLLFKLKSPFIQTQVMFSMKNIVSTLFTISVSFLFGAFVTYIAMSKQQMDAVLTGQNTYQEAQPPQTINDQGGQLNQEAVIQSQEIINQGASGKITTNNYSEQQAKQIIDNMPDYALEQYVNKFMAADASDVIDDKRRFAERAVEELYTPNDNQQLTGTALISFNYVMPEASANTSNVTKFAKIYAHLDTRGEIPTDKYVFVKWINNQTGQVLLFEKKNISANSNQNWVSFIPTDGWQVGRYDVRFYQFDSELKPIAQTTYNIYEVVD